MINNLLQVKKIKDDDLYKLLDNFEPSLNLDIGGFVGTQAIELCRDKHRVKTFEPFKDNLKYLKENIKSHKNIELFESAVTDYTGEGYLNGCKKIELNNSWSDKYVGGSAVGFLAGNGIPVKTIKLSDVIKEHVLMMKVDIQGGEYNCLMGAEELIDNYGIDIMFLEFTGDLRIIEFLKKKDYIIFDTEYLQWNANHQPSIYNNKSVEAEYLKLSNGLNARKIFYEDRPSDLHEYLRFLKLFENGVRDFHGQQTDLYCVHKSMYDKIYKLLNEIKN
jgi:FkbM family methyltransferase